ncbi:arsenic resistance N-acetyltransferase ArsN2 [Rhizobium sp. NTR19]|uniref:Arsenic resistance N-acetyltransferase ArsN2 n=1 Tax=Neorhizobium turbinariae TaxID=2937795 RepID=A0ABT0ISM2_9HYPH|nr:arsenic resistance N-acetyltransferase ArsN2 [Neorhizobium turbinariae]MCK8780844.1 arsenic resistance N-acetyltransferase ArsN2 [Neorhizobium turbinariae]
MTMRMEKVPGSDSGLKTRLAEATLPVDDLEEGGRSFFRFVAEREVLGYAGIEEFGSIALLRSVVVANGKRGRGFGQEMLALLLAHARSSGVEALYLLTTSAAAFFERNGFVRIGRSEAPNEILETKQASSLCPVSATLMKIDLTN